MKRRALFGLLDGAAAAPSSASDPYQHPIDGAVARGGRGKDIAGVVAMAADRKRVSIKERSASPTSIRRGPDARRLVPHCLDDQGDHLDRRHATDRAGPLHSRRAGGKISAAVRGASGVWRRSMPRRAAIGFGRRPAPSPSGISSLTPPGSATTSPVRWCAISSHAPAKPFRSVRWCSTPANAGFTAPAPIGSAGWSNASPERGLRTISGNAFSNRSACPTRSIKCRRTNRPASSPSIAAKPDGTS